MQEFVPILWVRKTNSYSTNIGRQYTYICESSCSIAEWSAANTRRGMLGTTAAISTTRRHSNCGIVCVFILPKWITRRSRIYYCARNICVCTENTNSDGWAMMRNKKNIATRENESLLGSLLRCYLHLRYHDKPHPPRAHKFIRYSLCRRSTNAERICYPLLMTPRHVIIRHRNTIETYFVVLPLLSFSSTCHRINGLDPAMIGHTRTKTSRDKICRVWIRPHKK